MPHTVFKQGQNTRLSKNHAGLQHTCILGFTIFIHLQPISLSDCMNYVLVLLMGRW